MSACRFQPRARFTYGASAEASRCERAGTTSTRPFSAPTSWSWSTIGASSRAQDAAGIALMVSSTALKPIHATNPAEATTSAYHLRERGTVNGSAAISTTPANSIASRVMLEPIYGLLNQTTTTESQVTQA